MIWIIMQGDRGRAYLTKRITPSLFCIILRNIRKPNLIIVLIFIQNISNFNLHQCKVAFFITCLIVECSSAVSGYELEIFILANSLQVALVICCVVFLLFLLCVQAVARLFLLCISCEFFRHFLQLCQNSRAFCSSFFWLYISTIDVSIHTLFTGNHYDTWRRTMSLLLY